MNTGTDRTRNHDAELRVEAEREAIEAELGRFEVAVDEEGRCVLTATETGWQFEARFATPHADASLIIEEVDA
ncbi:hypothetical protein [Egicoccus halophilus]|uniref:Amphi-Trp domain-containing protein n=1 Tax=Egicoccus halophilus TaxID=1670830 RepID=A0A8J3AB45_9ACTN|nr:hypothetical protein [Egicoccus halophilus]GGI09783.1 hypothetical protein GCM10011354_35790 [Egicoccus halophilus]